MTSREGVRTIDREPNDSHSGVKSGPRPFLSVVVPAYNEELRLPATLETIRQFLADQDYTSEVIVIDDGSEDRTDSVARELESDEFQYRVLRQRHRGKAAAVRAGVELSTGQNILFTDADLSTPIEAVSQLIEMRKSGYDIAIGSREGMQARRINEPQYRHLMGRAFNAVVQLAAIRGIRDTQCGFKLVSREVADQVFPKLLVHQSGLTIRGPRVSAFDVELLFVARKFGYTIAEVPVVWTHATGSKVRPGIDSLRMFIDVLTVRWNALRGKYN